METSIRRLGVALASPSDLVCSTAVFMTETAKTVFLDTVLFIGSSFCVCN